MEARVVGGGGINEETTRVRGESGQEKVVRVPRGLDLQSKVFNN